MAEQTEKRAPVVEAPSGPVSDEELAFRRDAMESARPSSTSTPMWTTSTARSSAAYRRGVADVDCRPTPASRAASSRPARPPSRDFSNLVAAHPAVRRRGVRRLHGLRQRLPGHGHHRGRGPESQVEPAIARSPRKQRGPARRPPSTARRPFRADPEVRRRSPRRRASSPRRSGIFVDPAHCKGCGECVEVCSAPGPRRAAMIDKVRSEPSGESTLERYRRDCLLLPDPAADAHGLPQREGAGRPDARRARARATWAAPGRARAAARPRPSACSSRRRGRSTARTRWASWPRHGCNTVYGSTYPYNPYLVPWTNSLFENGAGRRARDPRALGPGRATPIGGCGSSAATARCTTSASSRCRAWSRRGPTSRPSCWTRRSTRTRAASRPRRRFGGQVTKLSAFGKAIHGRPERRKELGRIMLAHRRRLRGPDHAGPHRTTSIGPSWRPTSIPARP